MSKRIASAHIKQTIVLGGAADNQVSVDDRTSHEEVTFEGIADQTPVDSEKDIYEKRIAGLEEQILLLQSEARLQKSRHEEEVARLKETYQEAARLSAIDTLKETFDKKQLDMMDLITSIEKQVTEIFDQSGQFCVDILSACFKKLVDECYRDEAFRIALIQHVVADVKSRQLVRIELSYEDHQLFQASGLSASYKKPIEFVVNSHLKPGDCIVALENGILDASLSQQSRVLEKLLDEIGRGKNV